MRNALIAVSPLLLILVGCGASHPGAPRQPSPAVSTTPVGASTTSATSSGHPTGEAVHIKLLNNPGATYGVGEPIVAYLSARIPNGDAFAKATTVTVNGQPVAGAWHFEDTNADMQSTYPIAGHFRADPLAGAGTPYWPAHAKIHLDLVTQGVETAPSSGQYFDDSLTLDFSTGAANISTVDCAHGVETLTPTQDGAPVHAPMSVSCGKASTATFTGTKVVMQKGETDSTGKLRADGTVMMSTAEYPATPIKWSVRITQSGEYVHDLDSNANIGSLNTSHGCTNLHEADAVWFYNWAQLGDVLVYANTGGDQMPPDDGLGDWNLPQSEFNNETPDT